MRWQFFGDADALLFDNADLGLAAVPLFVEADFDADAGKL